ncbi:phytoene desaturase family protein [Chloroflexota bacterium]
MNRSAIIIGGGMAGLSTGCYLQMNGYSTEIFEASNRVGGLCTCWDRKGYTIEGCLHGLVGSSPANPFYHLWNELIDMNQLSFITHDETFVFNFADGNQFYLYSNLSILEEYMKRIGPEDKAIIEEFTGGIRRMQKLSIPLGKPRELFNLLDYLKMVRYLPQIIFMKKWQNTSAQDFAERFKNPILRRAMSFILSPVLFQMFVSSTMDLKASGYPTYGSLEFAKLFERRYLSLGGRISNNSRVHSILVDENRAVGIELEKGGCKSADIIISAADGRTTIYQMLGGKYVNKKLSELYE